MEDILNEMSESQQRLIINRKNQPYQETAIPLFKEKVGVLKYHGGEEFSMAYALWIRAYERLFYNVPKFEERP